MEVWADFYAQLYASPVVIQDQKRGAHDKSKESNACYEDFVTLQIPHITLSNNGVAKITYQFIIEGKSSHGRPQKRWRENITMYLSTINQCNPLPHDYYILQVCYTEYFRSQFN